MIITGYLKGIEVRPNIVPIYIQDDDTMKSACVGKPELTLTVAGADFDSPPPIGNSKVIITIEEIVE